MTADGSDDHLIKLEAKPKGETFTFNEAPPPVHEEAPDELEPDDVAPQREEEGGDAGLELDDEDEPDEDDEPPAPCEAPEGFVFTEMPPSEDSLAFSKEASAAADALVGKSIIFHWPVIGWHVGTIQRRVTDGRVKRNGYNCNFYVYYEVDEDEVPSALSLEDYGGEDESSWFLLQEIVPP